MKRIPLGGQKEELDKRFTAISKLMDSFACAHEDFRGNQSWIVSSGSEEDDRTVKHGGRSHKDDGVTSCKSPIPNFIIADRVSSCPYPSVADEKSFHGLTASKVHPPPSAYRGRPIPELGNLPVKKKQKTKSRSSVKNSATDNENGYESKNICYVSDDVLKSFVTFWKEACREHNVYEVLEKMFQFYEISDQRKKKLKALFSSYPCLVLLNVAVTSIRNGMWDSIYDAFQESGQQGILDPDAENISKFEMIEVNVGDTCQYTTFQSSPEHTEIVPVEDLISKVNMYCEQGLQPEDKPAEDNQFTLLRRFCQFQGWVAEQFSVNDFRDLGHGEIYTFMEKHSSYFSEELRQHLAGNRFRQSPVEVCMPQHQLAVFLSQAPRSIWEEKDTVKQKITTLLSRQFPLPCLKITKSSEESHLCNFYEKDNHVTSDTVLFSSPLIGFHCSAKSLSCSENSRPEAIRVLCKAPMLVDLISWSHWDSVFAPVLGPLVEWLLKEVSPMDFQSLVTRDGKVIRIDSNASAESFLEASLRGSSYQTAVELLSLLSLFGGVENVPFALLRNHASHAFEVIFKNHIEETDFCSDIRPALRNGAAVSFLSTFFIEVLDYLPSEFRVLAAGILLPGFKAVVRDSASVVLSECKSVVHRTMLHDIGISLDISEWIDDFRAFTSASDTSLVYLSSNIRNSECSAEPRGIKCIQSDPTSPKTEDVFDKMNVVCETHIEEPCDHEINLDSTRLIESIRYEEFGMDPIHSASQNTMLEKQHARLGRALQCLSQELYSQDSHFLLELVQNADDNIYPDNVERTLGFILRDNDIVVLNNERGFSAQNIRALCDVGSSTKKRSDAGYIGHKGIGFKSVFRITDAPEIHSNGYNFKFDISEGQIGFVLPSVVPPVNVKYFANLICDSAKEEMKTTNDPWNTCIVLPLKPKSSTMHTVSTVISMFSDLHPSLLLFLHRLQCIRFRNTISNSLVIMRKEVIGDGIVKVFHGGEETTWLVVSKTLQNAALRPEVKTTEISAAFTFDITEDGGCTPNSNQQPVFAFLPLRNYGLKFIVQGDFVLPSSREEVDANSSWNQWLLSEFPTLFASAETSFCSLPFFAGYPGKAVAAYLSYIPLVSEVHGFFSCLPHLIVSKLRLSNCLILEGEQKWVPPCRVVRNWDEQSLLILPPHLLYDHLGLGFLDKDIVLTDQVANALGIESYGPMLLVRFLESLCSTTGGLSSMGVSWLCSWISALHSAMLPFSLKSKTLFRLDSEHDYILSSLRRIRFIPLSDGTYGSVDSEKIWYCDSSSGDCGLESFPKLCSKLRIVEPALLKCSTSSDHIIRTIQKIGVQRMTAHDILKVHILPAFSSSVLVCEDEDLTVEYLSFTMFHLQSGCSLCHNDGGSAVSNLFNNALISTNYGCIRITEAPIHFGMEYGNCVDVDNFSCLRKTNWKWHVVAPAYLKHPINKLLPHPVGSWRKFFMEIGVTDFVRVVQVEKNVTDLPASFVKNLISDGLPIFHDCVVKDWESSELTHILSSISSRRDRDESKILLEVLDKFWDDCFGDKVLGYCKAKSDADVKYFRSSFINDVCNIRWVLSMVDEEVHYPKDLFYDRDDEISSVLGSYAPYAIPRVHSLKLVNDVGFKTEVRLSDALAVIDLWRTSGVPFKASTAQMSKFYSFIWKEMKILKDKISPGFTSGHFIFVPLEIGSQLDDVVPGLFASASQVFWRDLTGSMDHIKCSSQHSIDLPLNKTLHHIYPDLHDFFVIECGVQESPSFHGYVEFLQRLSTLALPSEARDVATDIIHKWADEVYRGLVGSENISYLQESLQDSDFTIFPTILDRWVSLHPTFGLICWANSDDLMKEFKHVENIDFLNFGEPNDMTVSSDTKMFNLMKLLGIPILSEVVTRVAIYNHTTDSDSKTSLVNFCIPYAQRYIYSLHPEVYFQLKVPGCSVVDGLQVVVVEQLHYHNVINTHGITSNKKFECSSLLQDKILYTTGDCHPHTLFLELSKLFFGRPELHLANFLHMVTTMMTSGSSEEQAEFFILNSQKVPKLPDTEPVWSISCHPYVADDVPKSTGGKTDHRKPKKKPGINFNWPPVDWKTVPGFGSDGSDQFRTYPDHHHHHHLHPNLEKRPENAAPVPAAIISTIAEPLRGSGKEEFLAEEQLVCAASAPQNAVMTGRMGELLAFEYFSGACGGRDVRWVNSDAETGLPYDIIIGNGEADVEFVEVKSTKSVKKNWFIITAREWQFAVEKGECFSIAHILLSSSNCALKMKILRNPAMLMLQGKLRLVMMMPSLSDDDGHPSLREMNHQQDNNQPQVLGIQNLFL